MAHKGQRLLVLATKDDWIPVLVSLEQKILVKYVGSGMFSDPIPPKYETFREFPKFGEAVWGDAIQERRYLIMKKGAPIYSRAVHQNKGDTSYVVDHDNNPESVIFSPGGAMNEEKAVIQGEISKLSTVASAEEIFRALSNLIKEHFPAVKAYRVGAEALSLRNDGYRLTASIRSPVQYDLADPNHE